MPNNIYNTPLLAPDSPLDAHSRAVIQQVYDAEWEKSQELPTDDPLDPKRRKRVELTWNEMWTQPESIRTTLDCEKDAIAEAANCFGRLPIDHIYMTGCGDSIAVMVAVRSLFEQVLGIPCEPVQALDFTYYNYRPVNQRSMVITLSSSGATTRTVEAMMLGRALGAHTLALSNTLDSPLMAESERGLMIHAERKGWPTQSSTAAMAILVDLLLRMGRLRGVNGLHMDALESAFGQIPGLMASTLQALNDSLKEVAEKESQRKVYLYSGGGPALASAMFGAAKLKECSPDHGICIPLEEFHHYNSQKAGDPLFLIAPKGPSVPRALDTLHEGQRWGGQVYSIVDARDAALFEKSDRVFGIAPVPEEFAAFIYTIPVQLFAYHVAMAKFAQAERGQGSSEL
ncbi:MAG: SIS domain-containing protein [Anaerolineaceae bacterium]|nr:SIS domain-containing protein [Anaerolineaceae bacterium]